jgi:hypothetical protein
MNGITLGYVDLKGSDHPECIREVDTPVTGIGSG